MTGIHTLHRRLAPFLCHGTREITFSAPMPVSSLIFIQTYRMNGFTSWKSFGVNSNFLAIQILLYKLVILFHQTTSSKKKTRMDLCISLCLIPFSDRYHVKKLNILVLAILAFEHISMLVLKLGYK